MKENEGKTGFFSPRSLVSRQKTSYSCAVFTVWDYGSLKYFLFKNILK
jgi:hypothetical protein